MFVKFISRRNELFVWTCVMVCILWLLNSFSFDIIMVAWFKRFFVILLWLFFSFSLLLLPSAVGAEGNFLENPDTVTPKEVNFPQKGAAGVDERIIDAVKWAINYVLWLLALITLILLIYGWLQMLFNATDDAWYKKWFTILKNAAIALAFIAFSWLLVSLIFYALNYATSW